MTISRILVRYEDVPQELRLLLQDEGYEEVFEGADLHLVQTYSLPQLINLTPHSIKVIGVGEIPASGLVARVSMKTEPDAVIAGFPTSYTEYGEVEGLPEIEGCFFIVSKMVRDACPDRADLFYPAELVRDETGNIIGCKSLGI